MARVKRRSLGADVFHEGIGFFLVLFSLILIATHRRVANLERPTFSSRQRIFLE